MTDDLANKNFVDRLISCYRAGEIDDSKGRGGFLIYVSWVTWVPWVHNRSEYNKWYECMSPMSIKSIKSI